MPRIVIAACLQYPDLSQSNQALFDALRAAGADVAVQSWNAADQTHFRACDLVLLRQTWDYMADPGGFAAWAAWLRRQGVRIRNAVDLAIWNNDKRTLNMLEQIGVATPVTVPLTDHGQSDVASIPGDTIVLKPAFGGSGVGVRRTARTDFETALSKAQEELPGRHWLAQEFLPEIADGEWKLTCFDGAAAFAVHMEPTTDAFPAIKRSQLQATVRVPPAPARGAARAVGSWLGKDAVCFRLDGVLRGGQFICTELELTDPDLNLHLAPGEHAEQLATSIMKLCNNSSGSG